MSVKNAVRGLALVCATIAVAAFGKTHGLQDEGAASAGKSNSPHTITWWCADLNQVWRVDVPVVVGAGFLIPPDGDPGFPVCNDTAFPVSVPQGSGWTANTFWFGNKTYPKSVADALATIGYEFVSNVPHEDLLHKIVEIRLRVLTFPALQLVAEFSFDPKQAFVLTQLREIENRIPVDPIVNADLGIDLSPAEVGRLPMIGFPAVAPPLPSGSYRVQVFYVMSELHNDGLGLDDGNFLAPGSNFVSQTRFVVR